MAVALVCAMLPVLCIQAGCSPYMISVLGTPTSAERKVPAEYDITQPEDQNILVLVDQPAYLNIQANMRYLLTDSVEKMLQMRLKILPEFLIKYDTLADFRSQTPNFSLLSPEQIGSKLGADLVLLIVIDDCRIEDIAQTGYYTGQLDVEAQLIRVSTGEKLWPTVERSKKIKVSFESERGSPEVAAVRLAVDAAHCVMRYLYNAPKNQFDISDEMKDVGW